MSTKDTRLVRFAPSHNPAEVYLASLAPSARASMRSGLDAIARLLEPGGTWDTIPWGKLRYEHAQALRATLIGQYAPRTVNRMLSALRGAVRAAWNLQLIDTEDCQRVVQVKSVKASNRAGRVLELEEIDALLQASLNHGALGLRDAALVSTLYGAGLRRSEATSLDVESLDRRHATLKVIGKRNKERLAPIGLGWRDYVFSWADTRGMGPLFCGFRRHGEIAVRLTAPGIGLILERLRYTCAAKLKPFTAHDLRRSFATHLLDAGVDVLTVKDLMGHENVATTGLYDRRNEAKKREAISALPRPSR